MISKQNEALMCALSHALYVDIKELACSLKSDRESLKTLNRDSEDAARCNDLTNLESRTRTQLLCLK